MTTDPLIRPEGVYVGATEGGATRHQEDTVTDPAPAHTLDADGDGRPDMLPEAPDSLVSIPPVTRTVLYYVLALANGVAVPLAAAGVVDTLVVLIILNVASVFGFTLAANRVPAE